MQIDAIFNTVGGLGLFLYGMGLMSDGLKKAAGQKLRQLLESMTKKPLRAFTTGMVATALVQSSSATTVMIIGMVNAGLLSLRQAICVIFGTNVGTTATAWIVSLTGFEFKISHYALVLFAIGFLMQIIGKTRKTKSIGQILIGFGLLFIGIDFMKTAFGGLKESPAVMVFLESMAAKPLLAVLAGTVITMLLQSSSASIAIIQTMAISGAFGTNWENALSVAIPFVLGGNIGTTITAQIAAFRTNLGSRRTAWAHTLFNVIGSGIALPFIYLGWYAAVVHFIAPWELDSTTIAITIAIAHTLFNVINSVIFLPFAGILEKVVTSMIRPGASEIHESPVVLEKHLLDTPVFALEQAKREILRMAEKANIALGYSTDALINNERKKLDLTRKVEDSIDDFQHEITSYLVALSQRQLSDEVSIELPVLLHIVNDLERVGDHAVNIVEIAERKIEQKLEFSDTANEESREMVDEANLMFTSIITALQNNDIQAAHKALVSENKLNRMQIKLRRSHVQRMSDGKCPAQAGLIFIDLVDNLEKIGDHLTNVAQSVTGGLRWDGIEGNTLSGEFKAVATE